MKALPDGERREGKSSRRYIHMQKLKITLLGIMAAVAYGIVHDQITVRLCIEYFTVAHPPLFHTVSPTLLAICWGTVATCWAGMAVGIILAMVTQSENLPPVSMTRLCIGTAKLLLVMATCAALAGLAGWELARRAVITFPPVLERLVPANHHDRFIAVWFAHNTSYLVGFGGAGVWIYRLWCERGQPRVLSPFPQTKWAIVRAIGFAVVVVLILYLRLAKSLT